MYRVGGQSIGQRSDQKNIHNLKKKNIKREKRPRHF